MNARLLTADDLESYKKLLDRNFFGKERSLIDTPEKYTGGLAISNQSSSFRVYGGFSDDGELTSACAIHLWDKMKFYTLPYVLIHPKFSNAKFTKSFELSRLRDALGAAVNYAESKEFWQFFYATHIRNFKTRKDAWFKSTDMLVGRYDWSIETIIPANVLPSCPLHAALIYNQARGIDLVVKTARLKQELIFNKYHEKGLLPFSYREVYNESTRS
jgi:hypothetical protein